MFPHWKAKPPRAKKKKHNEDSEPEYSGGETLSSDSNRGWTGEGNKRGVYWEPSRWWGWFR